MTLAKQSSWWWWKRSTSGDGVAAVVGVDAQTVDVVADGKVDAKELEAQEQRVVQLMKEVEPLLSPEAHEKVTQLLCEVTAYDLMNTFHMAGKSRPQTKFRG